MAFQVMERELYNGKYHLVHNPNARGRTPRYLVNGTMKPKGVTTILGATLSKDLMQWAVDSAISYLLLKIPLITKEDLEVASVEYIRLRDAGGSTGSEAHELVETFLKEGSVKVGEASQEAKNALAAFIGWYETAMPKVLATEENVYSAQFNFCGTYDALMEMNGKVYLCDMKTSNISRKAPKGIYAEYFIQMGAYALAHNEQREYELKNGGSKLVQIDDLMVISAKKNGALDIVSASDLGLSVDDCVEVFRKVIGIYQFMVVTTEKLGGK